MKHVHITSTAALSTIIARVVLVDGAIQPKHAGTQMDGGPETAHQGSQCEGGAWGGVCALRAPILVTVHIYQVHTTATHTYTYDLV